MKITELTENLEKLFASRHMSYSTLRKYRTQWSRLKQFCIDTYGSEEFRIERGMAYFHHVFGKQGEDFDLAQPLDKNQLHVMRVVNVMEDFQLHGAIKSAYGRGKPLVLPKRLLSTLQDYKNDLIVKRFADRTRQVRLRVATGFLDFLAQRGVVDLSALRIADCDSYIKTWAHYSAYSIKQFLKCLRHFLRFLQTTLNIEEDIAEKLRVPRLPDHSLVPSCWTQEEIGKLLAAIERNSPNGKRAYAMILLACVLGIRRGDIARLRIGDFDLRARRLRFIQHKTGKPLELPLPKRVYEALADYLMNGRPKYYETDVIFIQHRTPFKPFSSGGEGLASILERLRCKAGIPKDGMKRGFHSLRHTAASSYLEMETPLPVIADILGHSDVRATAVYLKTGLKKLAECVLEPVEFKDEKE